jgi:nitrogen fixation NifU-like protein
MYSTAVLERVRNPRRVGEFPEGLEDVGTGQSGTLDEGTTARIQVRAEAGRIVEARFKVFGCSAAIAAAGLVAEWLEGATLEEGRRLTPKRVVDALTLPPERAHVARVAVDAAHRALDDVTEKTGRRP